LIKDLNKTGPGCWKFTTTLENQFIYPFPKGSKLIFFAPLGAGVTEENQ
jgi:hypothetical protein